MIQIRLGHELIYRCAQATPMILNLNLHYTRAADLVRVDDMLTDPWVPLALIARGRDAADVAISTTFGPNVLEGFRVWAEEMRGT